MECANQLRDDVEVDCVDHQRFGLVLSVDRRKGRLDLISSGVLRSAANSSLAAECRTWMDRPGGLGGRCDGSQWMGMVAGLRAGDRLRRAGCRCLRDRCASAARPPGAISFPVTPQGYWNLAQGSRQRTRVRGLYAAAARVPRMPGFPAVLAVSFLAFGESPIAARLLLAVIGDARLLPGVRAGTAFVR